MQPTPPLASDCQSAECNQLLALGLLFCLKREQVSHGGGAALNDSVGDATKTKMSTPDMCQSMRHEPGRATDA